MTLFIAPLLAERLPREQLLKYRTSGGTTAEATNATEWSMRGNEILLAMQKVMGKLPGNEKRCALDMRIEEEADCGSYVRQLISYAAEPGGRVPAYLCIPKSATAQKPSPAVLCLHPTENKIGHKVVVGLGGKENRQYAAELAERGFVTLSPSYVQLANYQPDLKALGYESGTMKAIWDNLRGLDLLESLTFVDHSTGFAAIGHSLGGHNSIFTAVFDSRIKVVVSSCGFDSFVDYYGGNIKGWTQERYMPRMADYLGHPQDVPFDFYELIAALGDRQVFVNAPLRDANFQHDSVDRIAAAAKPVFSLLGGTLTVVHPDSEHDFPDEARQQSYRLIESVLKQRP